MSGQAPVAGCADAAGRPGWERHLDRGLVARLGRRPTVIPSALGDRIGRRVEYFAAQAGALTRALLGRGTPAARAGDAQPIVHVRWRTMPESSGAGTADAASAHVVPAPPVATVVKVPAAAPQVVPQAARLAGAELARSPSSPLADARPVAPAASSATGSPAETTPDATASTRPLDRGQGGLAEVASDVPDFVQDGAPVELTVPSLRRRARGGAPAPLAAVVESGGISTATAVDGHSGPGAPPVEERTAELHVPAMRRNDAVAVPVGEHQWHGQTRLASAASPTHAPEASPAATAWERAGAMPDGAASVAPLRDRRAVVAVASDAGAMPGVASPSANVQEDEVATGPQAGSTATCVLPPRAPGDATSDRRWSVAHARIDRFAGPLPLPRAPAAGGDAPRLALPHAGYGRPSAFAGDSHASPDARQGAATGERMPPGVPVQEPLRVPVLSTGTQAPRADVARRPAWPAAIDIDRLAVQVERRIAKRRALDAERRGGWS